MVLKMCQISFVDGATPWTPLGELLMLPQTPSQLGRGTPIAVKCSMSFICKNNDRCRRPTCHFDIMTSGPYSEALWTNLHQIWFAQEVASWTYNQLLQFFIIIIFSSAYAGAIIKLFPVLNNFAEVGQAPPTGGGAGVAYRCGTVNKFHDYY